MMKIEDITKCNDAEASENLEEFDTPNTQSSNPNPQNPIQSYIYLLLLIIIPQLVFFLFLFYFNLCYYLFIMFL